MRGTLGRALPSFGGRQTGAALSKLAPAFNSQPDKPQYNLRKGSAQGSGTESFGHIKLGRAVSTQMSLPTIIPHNVDDVVSGRNHSAH